MRKLFLIFIFIILTLSLNGCGESNQPYTINEVELKQIAWNSLDELEKKSVILVDVIQSMELDVSHKENVDSKTPPAVWQVPEVDVDNYESDSWKEAKLEIVESKYYLKNPKHEITVKITFEGYSHTHILVYIDPVSKKVVFKDIVSLIKYEI